MARPGALQLLRKGKLLAGAVFPRFVDTWNWLVRAFDNMVGDGDLNPQSGYIFIDRTNPDRPVIRFDGQKAGGGAQVAAGGLPRRFDIHKPAEDEEPPAAGELTFDNPYYSVGGKTHSMNSASVSGATGKIVALRINATGTSTAATIEKYSDFTALQTAQEDLNHYTIPLYTISAEGEVDLDWRGGPDAAMGEF